ncbi:hypothetical protein ACCC88_05655 [Sphingomonas sp. Sphisp140]|uniref:hypothetical protein n=1 Tax=unclassified Sphingomonas TaxID=196159 RepID=UPI0039AEC174
MSDVGPGTRAQGSWLLAWLAGAGAALLPGLLVMSALVQWYAVEAPDNTAEGLDGWIRTLAVLYLPLAVVVLLSALCLVAMAALAERDTAKPATLWCLLGLIATTPSAFFLWMMQHLAKCPGSCGAVSEFHYAWPGLLTYVFGLLGTLAAYRVRHGVWHA